MTTTDTARPLYRVLGTTDDVTTCGHCGRAELKGTIRLGVLDADGNVEDVTYFGAVCGAKAAGWTMKDIRKAASAAERAVRDAERAAESARLHALRYTADCPLGPRMCGVGRREAARGGAVRPCPTHD